MKPSFVLGMCLGVSLTLAAQANPPVSARIVERYGKLPLAFEANQGQTDPQVKFLSRGAGYSLFLTPTEAVLDLRGATQDKAAELAAKAPLPHGDSVVTMRGKNLPQRQSTVLRLKLVGTNANAVVTGQDELPGKSNYFIGSDPKKWHTNVRHFAKVRYGNVYRGIDLVYYGRQRELEYDFVLQPGANPQAIRLGIEGAKRLQLEHGDLVMTNAAGDVHLRSPHVYQEANGIKQEVRGRYVITSKNEAGFRVGAYDRRRALVIDPVLAYSTYLGGSHADDPTAIAVDSAGNAYITGDTLSVDFPALNAIQPSNHGGSDGFVTKINADGTALVYSTYLGGTGDDFPSGIAVDSSGNAYVSGDTDSTDFPTVNAIQPTNHGGRDAFIAKINAAGNTLVYSTYLGGNLDESRVSIALDHARDIYVTGQTSSVDFPTVNAIQHTYGGGNEDAFVTEINATGTALVYSTYLGGSEADGGFDIAVDSAGNAYVAGYTLSTDFPTAKAIQSTNHGSGDGFVTKINVGGSSLAYSTYLGGSLGDAVLGIAVDSVFDVYLTGLTYSTDFPIANALQPSNHGGSDAFVTKINANGSALLYSTYLGGSDFDQANAIATDGLSNVYVIGATISTDFPTANALQANKKPNLEAFVTKIYADGGSVAYSTYLGGKEDEGGTGIAVDATRSAYLTGWTKSPNFPVTAAAFQPLSKAAPSGDNAFIGKIATRTFVGLSTHKLFFPTKVLGTTSLAKKITVTNQGSATLTIHKIFIGGIDPSDFSETNTCGGSLTPNASCTISVTFTPIAKNNRQAGLAISSSDPASPSAIALSGIGTVVSLSRKTLSFSNQPVGMTSAPLNVTLKNVGSTKLNFTGIAITGTNVGDFSETNTCGTSIAGGASCTITVTFTPTATGTRTAAVSISDDGGGSPQKVALTGTGT